MRRSTNVALLSAGLILAPDPGAVHAALPDRDGCAPAESSWRYVVLFDEGTPPAAATAEVDAACGTMHSYYPEIAVAVASSGSDSFRRELGPGRAFSAQRARTDVHRTEVQAETGAGTRAQAATDTPVPARLAAPRSGHPSAADSTGARQASPEPTASPDPTVMPEPTAVPELTVAPGPGTVPGPTTAPEPGTAPTTSRDPVDGTRNHDTTRTRDTLQAQGTSRPADRRALSTRQWNMRAVHAGAARRLEPGERDVVVGVLDSGIDPDHPELTHALDPTLSVGCSSGTPRRARSEWKPSTSTHGTHVAGILAAADDGHGTTGVAPGVRIASVKVVDDHGRVTPGAAVCGLLWAARHGFAATNNSFLVTPWPGSCTADGAGRRVAREAVSRAVRHAHRAGTLTVAAASNEAIELTPSGLAGTPARRSADRCAALPADLREVVSVTATTRSGHKAGYSSYGLGVADITAPGGGGRDCVLSTVPGGYGPRCGTSMAAPHVTGTAALAVSGMPERMRDRTDTATRVREIVLGSAAPRACPADYDLDRDGSQDAYCAGYRDYNGFYGHGIVDASAAVRSARTVPDDGGPADASGGN